MCPCRSLKPLVKGRGDAEPRPGGMRHPGGRRGGAGHRHGLHRAPEPGDRGDIDAGDDLLQLFVAVRPDWVGSLSSMRSSSDLRFIFCCFLCSIFAVVPCCYSIRRALVEK
jgi:hypothetical protein